MHLVARLLAALGMARVSPPATPPVGTALLPGINPALLNVGQRIMRIPAKRSSWDDYILLSEHHGDFIWTGDGEMVEQWNRQYGIGAGLGDIEWDVLGKRGEQFVFSYKGRSLQFTDLESRDNDIMQVLTINQLLQPDSEIRACVDSFHHSHWAWFALPPTVWRALEQEFGMDAVAYRFMKLPPDLAAFYTGYTANSTDADNRNYDDR